MGIGKIIRALHKENVTSNYARLGRLISEKDYTELKAIRKCQQCGAKSSGPLEIHHKIPVSRGGSNDRKNLLAVCVSCHAAHHNK